MAKKRNFPMEEEFRSSQVYKTLVDTGIPVANKIAQGLGRAAGELDQALNGFSSGPQRPSHPYASNPPPAGGNPRGPQGMPPQGPPPQQTAGPRPPYTPPQGRSAGRGYPPYSGTSGSTPPRAGYPAPNNAARYPAGAPPVPPAGAAPQPGPGRTPPQNTGVPPRPQTPPPQPQPQQPMKMVRKGSPAKFYITGAAALFYATQAPLYEPVHFLVFFAVLAGTFLGSGALFRGKKMFVPIEPEKPKEEPKKEVEEEKPSKTGNPEVDKIIEEGNEYLKKLRAADDAIPDESLSQCITRMEQASADIFRFIASHPEKAPQIRKFMNYYLPTTLKLLNSYQRLSDQSVKGENITSTMFNIAGMMHTVADAFEKQLDSLFSEEALDISADITVFETLLKQEGFVEETQKEKKP